MKRFTILLLSLTIGMTMFAQRRYHVENLTMREAQSVTRNSLHKIGSQKTAPIKAVGTPKLPVVLVQFSDIKFASDTINNKNIEHSNENVHEFYQNYCNGKNYQFRSMSYGSVRDYFTEQSNGQFEPELVVFGPVTLSNNHKYYGEDASNYSYDKNIYQFYRESLELCLSAYDIDWSQFDNNNDGNPDFIFFIFAGEGQNAYGTKSEDLEHSYLIWPKENTNSLTIKEYNVTFKGFGCTNEIYNDKTDGIGTMCHELSHGLGLPDFYDTNYKSFGLDYWDLMDSGSYCITGLWPSAYSGYEREFMGWQTIKELSLTDGQTITLKPMTEGGEAYKLVNPNNKNEYYILENRQSTKSDKYLGWVSSSFRKEYGANHGLMVTHVDYNSSSWNSNSVNTSKTHQRITILPADGELLSSVYDEHEPTLVGYTEEYKASIVGDLYPGSKNVTSIPSSRFTLFTNGTLPTEITNITEKDDLSIVIELNGGDPNSIEEIVNSNDISVDASAYYDLSGRRVEAPARGIYIKGGKKVFVK